MPWSFVYLVVRNLFALVWLLGRPRRSKELEILVLRHELAILADSPPGEEAVRRHQRAQQKVKDAVDEEREIEGFFDLMTPPPRTVYLFDEPERHLHLQAQVEAARFVERLGRSRQVQLGSR